jgi:glycerol-1-phosphate dehydrogenase [NAD(P)+]
MDPTELLGTSFACECGRTHSIPIRAVVYSEQAFAQLPGLLEPLFAGRRLVLFADRRTFAAAGEACAAALAKSGWQVQTRIVADGPHGSPVCDDLTRDTLLADLPPADGFLAVGSGTIGDLVKWIACDLKLPYAMVATAASMNGYASDNIAPAIRGVKRVVKGIVPGVILAAPSVIRQAPFELTAAGLGDVIAKPVSMADWQLNQLLFDEYYCPVCAQLIRDLEPGYLERPEAIRARAPAALAALFQALIYSGVSMTMAGTSFPASGGEHLVSHALDMTAMARGSQHDYHGRQVGLGTIFACALYERLFALDSPDFRVVNEPTDPAFWESLAGAVEEEHALKRTKAEQAVRRLRQPGIWDRIRASLAPGLRPAAEIKRVLRAAGAAHRIDDIGCARERFLAAALRCHQLRERYTVIDLARAAGILPGAAGEIIEEYLN